MPYDEFIVLEMRDGQLYHNEDRITKALVNGKTELKIDFVKGKADNPKINAMVLVRGSLSDTHHGFHQQYEVQVKGMMKEQMEQMKRQQQSGGDGSLNVDSLKGDVEDEEDEDEGPTDFTDFDEDEDSDFDDEEPKHIPKAEPVKRQRKPVKPVQPVQPEEPEESEISDLGQDDEEEEDSQSKIKEDKAAIQNEIRKKRDRANKAQRDAMKSKNKRAAKEKETEDEPEVEDDDEDDEEEAGEEFYYDDNNEINLNKFPYVFEIAFASIVLLGIYFALKYQKFSAKKNN